jgi:hypothetical protein
MASGSKRRQLVHLPPEYAPGIEFGTILFPPLYEFENGLRIAIDRFLSSCYTPDWWERTLETRLPVVYDYATKQQKKRESMPWIGAATSIQVLPIHLVTLGQLEEIVKEYKSDCIPQLFPTMEFFLGHMEVIKRVRNLYSHMFPCVTKDDCSLAKREIRTLATHINTRL